MLVRDRSLSTVPLLCLALLALLPRLANLGGFSLWLDEIIETNQASGSFLEMLAALRADAVHPPLEGVIAWVGLQAGLGETARRLIPIAFGVGTILVVARWAARRFGRLEGLLVGTAMALAPFHVHYSQELRPYALALFCAALSLTAADRLIDAVDARRVVGFFFAVLATLYTHYLSAAILVPLVWLVLERAFVRTPLLGPPPQGGRRALRREVGDEGTAGSLHFEEGSPSAEGALPPCWGGQQGGSLERPPRPLLLASPLFALGWALAYAPWISVMLDARQQRMQRPATRWHLGSLCERWHELTFGTESHALCWTGLLALVLVGIGIRRAARSAEGRAVIAGALAGTVGVEIVLQLSRHWSEARYMLVGWLFLAVLLGLGLAEICRFLRALAIRPALKVELQCALLGTFALAAGTGIVWDYAHRSDWLWAARVIVASSRPGEPVFALNASTEICLAHYLPRAAGSRRPPELIPLDGSVARLGAAWPARGSALLVRRGRGRGGEVIQAVRSAVLLAEDPPTQVKIWLLGPDERLRAFPGKAETTRASERPEPPRKLPARLRPRPERWEPLSRFLLGFL